MTEIALRSNAYAKQCSTDQNRQAELETSGNEIATFYAILMYMSVVRLPDKRDY